jgi:hypothetical protein
MGERMAVETDGDFVYNESMDFDREEGVGKRTLEQRQTKEKNRVFEPLKQNFIPVNFESSLASKYDAWGLQQPAEQVEFLSQDVRLPDDDGDSI